MGKVNAQTWLKRCLIVGMLFGVAVGIVVGLVSILLNYMDWSVRNLVLVLLYHVIIYLPVGLAVGLIVFLGIWVLVRLLPSLRMRIQKNLAVVLSTLFLALFGLFLLRLSWAIPYQKEKKAFRFEKAEVPRADLRGIDLSWNKEPFIRAKPDFNIVVFAVDGLSFSVIDSLLAEKKLPNIARLLESGARAKLQTFRPTRSPILWTSIASSKYPEEHGIWDFMLSKLPGTSFTRGDYVFPYGTGIRRLSSLLYRLSFIQRRSYTSNLRKVKAFWNILSDYERRVGVIGWYTSFPAEAVNGFLVSDGLFYTSRYQRNQTSRLMTYPPDLYHAIKDLISDTASVSDDELASLYNIAQPTWQKMKDSEYFGEMAGILKETYLKDKNTFKVTKKLLDEYGLDELDVLAVYFKEFDEVSHATCEDKRVTSHVGYSVCWESVAQAYMRFDERIGEVLSYASDSTAVMIVSDHGFSYGELTGDENVDHWGAPDGVLILSGPNIKANIELSELTVFDILPTLLYMENLPVALDFRGRVVLDFFRDRFVGEHPVRYVTSYEEDRQLSQKPIETSVDKEIERRLKSLGYIR